MKKKTKLFSILITLIASIIIGYIEIEILKSYGWTIFVIIPLMIGFLPVFIYGKHRQISKRRSYKLSFLTLGIALIGLLVFAIEGIICITMALPILSLLVWFGSYIGFLANDRKWTNPTHTTLGVLLICIGSMSFDYTNKSENLIPVETTVIVNASIEKVWENVVTFNKMMNPEIGFLKLAFHTQQTQQLKGLELEPLGTVILQREVL